MHKIIKKQEYLGGLLSYMSYAILTLALVGACREITTVATESWINNKHHFTREVREANIYVTKHIYDSIETLMNIKH